MNNPLSHFIKTSKTKKPTSDITSMSMAKFYHGTHKPAAIMIQREGLKPVRNLPRDLQKMSKNSAQTNTSKTYFFKDKKDAAVWSDAVSKFTGFPKAIVEVDIPKSKVERDYNMPYGEAYSYKGIIPPEKTRILTDEEGEDNKIIKVINLDEYDKNTFNPRNPRHRLRLRDVPGIFSFKPRSEEQQEFAKKVGDITWKNPDQPKTNIRVTEYPSETNKFTELNTRLTRHKDRKSNEPETDTTSEGMAWSKGLDAEDIPLAKGRWQKGERTYTKKRVLMDPDEFLQRQYEQRPGKNSTYTDWIRSVSDTRIEKLKHAIMDPKQEVPVPIEEYTRQGKRRDLQEGRHRGLAAKELGVKVPVILARQKSAPWDRINQEDHYTHKYEDEGKPASTNNDWEKAISKFEPDTDNNSEDMAIRFGVKPRGMSREEWTKYKQVLDKVTHKDTPISMPRGETIKMNTVLKHDREIKKLEKVNPFWRREDTTPDGKPTWNQRRNTETFEALKGQGYSEDEITSYIARKNLVAQDFADVLARQPGMQSILTREKVTEDIDPRDDERLRRAYKEHELENQTIELRTINKITRDDTSQEYTERQIPFKAKNLLKLSPEEIEAQLKTKPEKAEDYRMSGGRWGRTYTTPKGKIKYIKSSRGLGIREPYNEPKPKPIPIIEPEPEPEEQNDPYYTWWTPDKDPNYKTEPDYEEEN
jgi:hypothetical protein